MISVQMDVKQLNRWLSDIEKKHVPFATSKALNVTAMKARDIARRVMRRVLDRPTPFVIRGLRAQMSTKRNLTAFVGYRLPQGNSAADGRAMVRPQISGGDRGVKRVERILRRRRIIKSDEYLTPSKLTPRDNYGNIKRQAVDRMLADLGSRFTLNRARGKKAQYFVGTFGSSQQKMIAKKKNKTRFIPFMIIIKKPHYKKRFDLQKIVDHTVAKHYSKNFKKAFTDAMRTAR